MTAAGARWASLAALGPIALLSGVRLLSPQSLDDNGQAEHALYVLDIWHNGNWILPLAQGTLPATTPPLYAWLATVASLTIGGPTPLVCRLPSALAMLGVAWLIFRIGSERFTPTVGIAAAWIFAGSHIATTLSTRIQPDMLLTLLTTTALLALHRVGARGAPSAALMGVFWAATSLSILAKGPAGALVVGGGLTGLWFVPTWRESVRQIVRSRWTLLMLAPLVWILGAWAVAGTGYLRSVVWGETVERALASGDHAGEGQIPGTLLMLFLTRFLPWSPVALLALAAAPKWFRTPEQRRDLAPIALWFGVGLLLFSLPRVQREEYLLPLLPAASLLVAAVLIAPDPRRGLGLWRAALTLAAAGGLALAMHARHSRGADVEAFAGAVSSAHRGEEEIVFYGPVAGSVRFLLDRNVPSFAAEEIGWKLESARERARGFLLVTTREGAVQLQQRWPDAFRERLDLRHGTNGDQRLLLLEPVLDPG